MFEQLMISMGITAVTEALKDPAHKAKLEAQLVEVANSIYAAYGLVPPTPST